MSPYTKQKQTLRQKRLAVQQWMLSATFRCGLLLMIGVFGVLYVMQTSEISTKGFDMSELETSITQLRRENEHLEFDIAQHRSLRSVYERLAAMNFVEVAQPRYVTPVGTAVARR